MAVTMRQATSNMTSAVKGMNEDMETTNLERVGPSPPPLPIPPMMPLTALVMLLVACRIVTAV